MTDRPKAAQDAFRPATCGELADDGSDCLLGTEHCYDHVSRSRTWGGIERGGCSDWARCEDNAPVMCGMRVGHSGELHRNWLKAPGWSWE